MARGAFFSVRASWNGQRDREVAERAVRRHLYSERRQLRKVVLPPRGAGDRVVDLALDVENHRDGRSVGKFVIRLQFVTNGLVESIGHSTGVLTLARSRWGSPERRELVAVDLPDADIGQKIHHPELPVDETIGDRRPGRRACTRRTADDSRARFAARSRRLRP